MLLQVGTLNYMSPEAILGGSNNIRGAPPMKVRLHGVALRITVCQALMAAFSTLQSMMPSFGCT